MKVCFITEANNLTGSNRSLLDLLMTLHVDEVEPIVLLPSHGPMEEELAKIKISYYVYPYFMSIKSSNRIKTLVKQVLEYVYPFAFAFFLKSKKVELVHNNSFLTDLVMAAAKQAGIPYICHIRELVEEDQGRVFINKARQINLLQAADAAIVISRFVYKKYSKLAPEQKFVLIHNGVNIASYLDEQHSLFKRGNISLLMVGQITEGKGQLEAVQAAEILMQHGIDFSLKIVGGRNNTSYQEIVEQYIQKNGIKQVELVPFVDDKQELRKLRHECDIGLVCSRAEAMGRVTIESQLAGCLTIGANAGATPELIQDGETGLLYEFGSPSNLAEKITYAINHIDEMRLIAKQGQQYAKETYDSYVYGQKILKLYREVLEKHSRTEI